ncbi:MAG: SsrA-binding protein SmpB [Paludibacteraceae bacterium]|nr:SsrA-binding protein SmpB [Paludibacteraceae bacterium]
MHKTSQIYIKNRRASFDYELLDKFTAGIVLLGTEIKSVRESKVNLSDSYCLMDNSELWVKGMHIAEYKLGNFYNHSALRDRKLLLTRKELKKIERVEKESGLTIVPTALYINEKGLAKLNISIARGKKSYDKRQSLKEKEDKRQIDRAFKV